MTPEPTRAEFLHLTRLEVWIFYLLVFTSIGIMLVQIWQRAKLWRQGNRIQWANKGLPIPQDVPTEGAEEAGPKPKLDWGFPGQPDVTRWVGNVLVFILGQKKVRTSRPKSGAPMHLLLFYGFLTLFIGTTLLAINTYSPIKFHYGLYFLIYEMTLDVMGAAFVLGVGWALFRRLKMSHAELGRADLRQQPENEADKAQYVKQWLQGRRRPLTSAASDYWTLALLFVLGFTGYLLEAARMSNQPHSWDWSAPVGRALSLAMPGVSDGGYRFIWWFHMIWVFVFFAVLPRMRIRHVVMAILTAAGRPEQPMGELKPISIEEVEKTGQIGVALAKDYSRWHLMSLDACMECGRCTEVCPAWNVGKVLNPKQVVQDLRGSMASGTAVAEAVSEEALWACTTCNACVEACPVLIRHVDMIVDSRRHLVAEGRFSGTGAVMLRQVASTNNAWGAPASSREDWMKDLDIPLCRNGVEFEFLFWVGCAGATDPGAVKTTKAVASLLKKAGVKFACLGQEEACTGDPVRRVGDEFLFQEKAMANASVFQKYEVKKVVTACPHCFNTLKNEYGQFEAKMEVFHHSQLLEQLIAEGRLKSAQPAQGEVTFHDPCYLGRINNESDAPRAVLGDRTDYNHNPPEALQFGRGEAGERRLAEPKAFARKTLCCGAGGGRMWMEEAPDQRPANRRAEQLLATGAKTVAIGCPFCRIMLDAGIKQVTEEEIRLVDLAEMLQDANS